MYYIYVLWSDRLRKRYIGSTQDIVSRIREHNNGENKFTKGGTPWRLLLSEGFETRSQAYQRERFLKSGVGRKWLDEIIGFNGSKVKTLGRSA